MSKNFTKKKSIISVAMIVVSLTIAINFAWNLPHYLEHSHSHKKDGCVRCQLIDENIKETANIQAIVFDAINYSRESFDRVMFYDIKERTETLVSLKVRLDC